MRNGERALLWSMIASGLALVPLGGCALYRAATFSSADGSYVRGDDRVRLEAFAPTDGTPCQLDNSAPGAEAALSSVFLPAVATIAMNVAESEINAYLASKQKEFTAQYSATVNAPFYYGASDASPSATFTTPSITCLRLRRTVLDSKTHARTEAFQWVGTIVVGGSGNALRIRNVALRLSLAAARTDSTSRKVDVSVEVKLDSTYLNENGAVVSTSLADKVLAYPGIVLPASASTTPQSNDAGVSSSWFPTVPQSKKEADACVARRSAAPRTANDACGGITAITVAVGVTEVGSGGDTFGTLGKEIDDNKSTLNKAVSDAVSKIVAPSSGSSTGKSNSGSSGK